MVRKGFLLLNFLGLSFKKYEKVVSYFEDIDEVFTASEGGLLATGVFTEADIKKISLIKRDGLLEKEIELIAAGGFDCLDVLDKDYPQLLRQIDNPPLVLYVRGDRRILGQEILAIVGSRLATVYGISVAEEFSGRLASLGFVIASGLARGIDTAAHKGALSGGKTIAVLGSGLLRLYPRENERLAENISRSGAIISEFPLNTPPLKENFPRRNRVVSGISKGVLVVEAAVKSGALITARLALEQNREVFAIPGNIDSFLSQGTNKLIKDGACLVESFEDILGELPLEVKKIVSLTLSELGPGEREVLDIIRHRPSAALEEIAQESGLNYSSFGRIVLDLQLKGLIREFRPGFFMSTALGKEVS
ncbi:MAG: DNA-processing protein DprA [Candidatus Omnitrophica bacterium]|nr:DNA-processing protein DprA [Candidatus Omnitrophota bacterium]MDD5429122.1 DNA-processing protein DprA [Candidatus Omnitrophota bacterium]